MPQLAERVYIDTDRQKGFWSELSGTVYSGISIKRTHHKAASP